MKKSLIIYFSVNLLLLTANQQYGFGQTYHDLNSSSYIQDWTNTELITINDDWSGVSSIRGYRGDGGTSTTGTDPQTILSDLSTVIDVNANQANPNDLTTGGLAEFEITDPVVALQGSGTADAPNIVIYINTTGCSNIKIKYVLRDVDGSPDDAIQPVALQYRIGETADFINIPAGFIGDASTGPNLAVLVTPVDILLPTACYNQSQVQIRIITSNAAGGDEWIGIDNITVEVVDETAPVPEFDPANAATDVEVNVTLTITFDEPVRKTDGNPLENSDLGTLVILKETNATGDDVPFTAVINEAKKVITVTPSSSFDYSQIYYLAIGAVEDESGNESTGSDIIFTTIDEPTPTVTVTYPVGGEVFYAGQDVTVTWDYENITNIKTESWVPDDDNNYSWITMAESTPAVDEEHDYTIPSDTYYGTQYKVRVSDVDNPDVYSESGSFTVLASASSLLELRTRYNSGNLDVDDVIKLNSEAIITYKLSSTNIYIQDTEAGLLIYDSGGKITTPYDLYDGITGLTGSIATDNNILEIIPVSDPGAATSSDNTVTPVTLTAASLNTDYDIYESMLIKINEVTFADAGSTFQSSQSYNITDESGTTVFYTKFSSADYIGTTIPSGLRNVTGICMQQNTTAEISSRNLLDFEVATGIEKASPVDLITIYPVPATSVLNISNVPNLRSIEILDVSGRVIETIKFSSDEVIQIPVYKLKRGLYLIRFKTTNGNLIRKFVKS